MACATAGDADNIAFVLDHLGRQGFFDAVVGAHDVLRGKPHPDLFLLAAQRMGVDPAECLVFEDAEAGVRAGVASGGRVVVVGGHASATTAGLPHIPDFTRLSASLIGGVISLRHPS